MWKHLVFLAVDCNSYQIARLGSLRPKLLNTFALLFKVRVLHEQLPPVSRRRITTKGTLLLEVDILLLKYLQGYYY